jgi:hypothetical protein
VASLGHCCAQGEHREKFAQDFLATWTQGIHADGFSSRCDLQAAMLSGHAAVPRFSTLVSGKSSGAS